MNKKIVKYDNKLNELNLNTLTSLEQDILMHILYELKDKGQTIVEFDKEHLLSMVGKNLTDNELNKAAKSLFDKVFKLDYTMILPPELNPKWEKIQKTRIVWLFDELEYTHSLATNEFLSVRLQISNAFEYLVNSVYGNFTSFELLEFKQIESKYGKTLYRKLKQFKIMGKWEVEWSEFLRIMNLENKNYSNCDIDKAILKPLINKELKKGHNLFQASFKNLSYKKTYKRLKASKGKQIDKIIFTFIPEKLPEKNDEAILHNAAAKIRNKGKNVSHTHIIRVSE
jgi:plasmid replication initiation protein